MADDTHTLLDRIEEKLAERGISARELSMRVTGKPDLVRDIKRKGHVPTAENLAAIAEQFDTSVEWLLGRSAHDGPMHSDVSVRDLAPGWRGPTPPLPGIPLVGTGDCAELTVISAETGKEIMVERSSFDPEFHVRYVRRPLALANARDIYAIYFHGSSMEPRYFAGETGLVDPRRPAGPGDYVLVQLNDGETDEVSSAMVKRLVRQTAKEYVLEQHNPVLTFRIPRGRVARVHRLIPPSEMLD